MPYTKQTWQDEVPQSAPVKYSITDDALGEIATSAIIEVETPIAAGSPVNAARLNHMEDGIETAQTTAETAAETANAAIPKSLVTAIGDLIYATANATLARFAKPSVDSILEMTSAGIPNWKPIVNPSMQMQVVAELAEVDTATGIGYFYIPLALNGMNLVRAQAMVMTAGTTNATTVQVRNLTKYPSNDALSTAINIASGATVGTPGTIASSYDDVTTNDKIKIYVTAQSTTKPKGLWVILEYQLP